MTVPTHSVKLVPFGDPHMPFHLQVSVRIAKRCFEAAFRFSGDVSDVLFDPRHSHPSRRDRLWERTCFEAFLNPAGDTTYWEFNASPSGDWAVYRFSSYRADMRPETRVRIIEAGRDTADPLRWKFSADLSTIPEMSNVTEFRCGFTAVVETKSGSKSYWAIAHSAANPDFHDPAGFRVELKAETEPKGRP